MRRSWSYSGPDDKRIFLLARQRLGLSDEEAYTFVQELQNMAAANLIARFEAKLDALNAKFDGLKDEMQRERRILWALVALIGAAVVRYLAAG